MTRNSGLVWYQGMFVQGFAGGVATGVFPCCGVAVYCLNKMGHAARFFC